MNDQDIDILNSLHNLYGDVLEEHELLDILYGDMWMYVLPDYERNIEDEYPSLPEDDTHNM